MEKYEFTGETKNYYGKILHRIRALIDFRDVKAGELGGWIEKESNLSQHHNCWVGDDAIVRGDAVVKDDAIVKDDAVVVDNAIVGGRAVVKDDATVKDDAVVKDNAVVKDDAVVVANAIVGGRAIVKDNVFVGYNTFVGGYVVLKNNDSIRKDGYITSYSDYLTIGRIGSRKDYITFYKTKDNGINVSVGCFCGSIEDFLKAVEKTHGNNDHAKIYKLAVEMAKVKIK